MSQWDTDGHAWPKKALFDSSMYRAASPDGFEPQAVPSVKPPPTAPRPSRRPPPIPRSAKPTVLLSDTFIVLEQLPHGQLRIRDARSDVPERWRFCEAISADDLQHIAKAMVSKRTLSGFPW